jgi:hypothetical protein
LEPTEACEVDAFSDPFPLLTKIKEHLKVMGSRSVDFFAVLDTSTEWSHGRRCMIRDTETRHETIGDDRVDRSKSLKI